LVGLLAQDPLPEAHVSQRPTRIAKKFAARLTAQPGSGITGDGSELHSVIGHEILELAVSRDNDTMTTSDEGPPQGNVRLDISASTNAGHENAHSGPPAQVP
jgi:hypothetical protein